MKAWATRSLLAAMVAVLALARPGAALGDLALTLARVDFGGLGAEGVALTLDWQDITAPAAVVSARRVSLPGPLGVLEGVTLRCARLHLAARGLRCPAATLAATHAAHGEIDAEISFTYAASGALELTLVTSAIVGGRLEAELQVAEGRTRLTLNGRDLALEGSITTTVSELAAELTMPAAPDAGMAVQARFAGFAFSNAPGTLAGEALSGELQLGLREDAGGAAWTGHARVALARGGAYAEPVYLDLAQYPVTIATDYRYEPATASLALSGLALEQPGVMQLEGRRVRLIDGALAEADITVGQMAFPAAYEAYLAGFLVGTPLARLDVEGALSGRVAVADGALSALDVVFERLDLEDRDGRLALYGFGGEVHWAADGANLAATVLHVDGGFLYGAGFDATDLVLGIAGAAVDLLEPTRIPLLGGALTIERFTLRDYGSDELALGLEAALEPIDLGQLTLALDWPPFAGTLSGRLPLLTYTNGVVTLGGKLEARAFDGEISIEGLRIARPLGLVPEIEASIHMRHLDLAQITEVVPFGRITGRLDADITDLRMLKGEPVRFDASFRTPPEDDSRHLLSQRAVDTISRVAGGGGAVLSTTFLRMFEDFAYDRLGISCRLENDVCHMNGIAPAEDGYYIVKGAWLPRVDLIGRVHRVHWSRLMSQLEQALAEGEFRIE